MATSDNLPLPNCDSDGKAENMRQRTVVWLIYHQSECHKEVSFVNFPCASEIVYRQGVSVDHPECVAVGPSRIHLCYPAQLLGDLGTRLSVK